MTCEGEYDAQAGFSFVSGAGIKKAIFAYEDSVMCTVHPWTGPEDIELIEAYFTEITE